MAEKDKEVPEEKAAKESPMGLVIALVVVSVMAVGAGWFLGGMLGKSGSADQMAAAPKTKADSKKKEKKTENPEQVQQTSNGPLLVLEPIIVTLRKSDNTFLRLELAIVGNEDAEFGEETRLQIGSEVAAYAQTLTLQQISGPSGYLHFREDILDRAKLSTDGQVKDVYILSMVAE